MKEPNEELITRWIDGELSADEEVQMQAYLAENPELNALKESSDQIGEMLRAEVPYELPVPSSEFFGSRIKREIDQIEKQDTEARKVIQEPAKQSWFMPAMAAAAALAIGFFGGFKVGAEDLDKTNAGTSSMVAVDHTVVFSPDQEVRVQLVDNEQATLILLDGVDGLPESIDLAGQPNDLFMASHQQGAGWQ